MRPRVPARLLAVALFASLLSPVAFRPPPAAAATTCTHTADTSASDYRPSAWTDTNPATSTWVRVLAPISGTNCTKPAAGWPVIVYLHGWSSNRCESMAMASRPEMASWGYVVLSFTARGKPYPTSAGKSGCNASDDAKDALDDSGTDYAGPRDMQDIVQLIDWLRDSFNASPPSGCGSATNPCADTNTVGATGFSYGGQRSWKMAVPSPTNPHFTSRLKAIAPVAGISNWTNVRNISSDGATPTANYRPYANGGGLWPANQGWEGHTIRNVHKHFSEAIRYAYRKPNDQLPPETKSWLDEVVTLDDDDTTADGDPVADKVKLITIPTFVIGGWLDGFYGIHNATFLEAYNKLTTADKYLYMGSCGHVGVNVTGDTCHTHDTGTGSNRTRMRDKLKLFFDKYLKGATTSVGGPVFYSIPPVYQSSTNNAWTPTTQTWGEATASTWPPTNSATYTLYLRDNGKLLTASETIAGSSKTIANDTTYPLSVNVCYSVNYGSTEFRQYETDPFTSPGKLAGFDADLWVSTTSSRLQVFVDAFVVTGSGEEKRIWQGQRVAPTNRNATANTPYRFVFKPGSTAWTFDTGQKLRIKVTSKFASAVQPEPGPSTLTLHHNPTYQSNVKLTFVP
ncbi:MAG TPA: CocE/NonD family hydrolase [Acidimicrobiales bacterium]|nr:CocE/NonD family hydrolase [Acidimicrobiales bacterium]